MSFLKLKSPVGKTTKKLVNNIHGNLNLDEIDFKYFTRT